MTVADNISINTYTPSIVNSNINGQSVANPEIDGSTRRIAERNFSSLMRNNAYQRLDESSLAKQNPPFEYGSAGRLFSPISDGPANLSPRISRGYIRRSASNKLDPTDGYRLYFMYNPTNIQRDYVAYLEQQALDPFNTIYGSNNLVAPPGILDFSFELMFDRQIENANGAMPRGVLEDFDYFDLVIRGVVPDGQGPHLQDNGIMMINPRNVTIVFSPQLSVQGRPYRAAVQYTKFDHNMVPIRMTIAMSMKVFYFGKIREDFKFASTQQEATYAATIPYEQTTVQFEVDELFDLTTPEVSFADGESGAPFVDKPAGAFPPSNSGFILERPYNFPTHKDHNAGGGDLTAIDIGAATGRPVYSPWAGTVVYIGSPTPFSGASFDPNGGNAIVIQSDLVDGKQYSLYMAHFQSPPLVKNGERVFKGQNVAFVGQTGRAYGPHVHCSVTDSDWKNVFEKRGLPVWDFMKRLEGD